MQTLRRKIVRRILRFQPGRAFMPKDFLDIATRGTIDVTLAALVRERTIRRVRRGLYDVPRVSATFGGNLSPDIDQAARALARRYNWTIVPEGAWAANLLGLSTQVPAKIVYLSDGPNQTVQIGRRTIRFKHTRPNALGAKSGRSALVIQALRFLGRPSADDILIRRLRELLPDADRRKLVRATRFAPEWIHDIAQKVAGAGR